jgi:FkbM family methyltransferase
MQTQLKTWLMNALGEGPLSWLHAIRFVYLLRTGKPDPEVAFLSRFLKPGDVAVDVGANGANWTVALAHAVEPKGVVFAFEADPYYALVTRRTLGLLRRKDVVFFPFGLSEHDETVQFRVFDSAGERLSGRSGVDPAANKGAQGTCEVQLRRLDGLLENCPQLLQSRFIKCDAEGYELFVFRGAEQILQRARPVVVLETGDFSPYGYEACDLHFFFRDKDYVALAVNSTSRLSRADENLSIREPASPNRILIPAECLGLISDLVDE